MGALPGYAVDVISADPQSGILPVDQSLVPYVKTHFGKRFTVTFPRYYRWLPALPDRGIFLKSATVTQAESLDLKSYDCLVTWSQFHSSHLAGWVLKKRNPNLKWVAHFSDPWADNPFNPFPLVLNHIYRRMEKRVIEACDEVVFTSERTLDLVMKKYSESNRSKAHVIPHPFDSDLYSTEPERKDQRLIFRYLGKFYGPRNPGTLFEAIKRLQQKIPRLEEKICFEFIGTGSLNTGGLPDSLVKVLPTVDYVTSLKLMGSADVLLVIDAPFDETVFLPSKLVDYLGARRRIFGITPNGTSRDLILKMGGKVANPDNVVEICEKLESILIDSKPFAELPDITDAYSIQSVRRSMARLMVSAT